MANKYTIEQIEAFLKGKLQGSELEQFQADLQSDAGLKSEVDFQQILQEGLFEARKLELKQRLNNIPIETGFEFSAGKIAAGIAIVGLVGLGAYFGLSDVEEKKQDVKKQVVATSQVTKSGNSEIIKLEEPKVEVSKEVIEKEISNPETFKSSKPKTNLRVANVVSEEVTHEVDFSTPHIPSEHQHSNIEKHHDLNSPNGKLNQGSVENHAIPLPQVTTTKGKFHYSHYENKLVLVGEFDKGPYQVIELNTNHERSLYLFYDNSFYEIKDEAKELQPLKLISDSGLVKKLKLKINKK